MDEYVDGCVGGSLDLWMCGLGELSKGMHCSVSLSLELIPLSRCLRSKGCGAIL